MDAWLDSAVGWAQIPWLRQYSTHRAMRRLRVGSAVRGFRRKQLPCSRSLTDFDLARIREIYRARFPERIEAVTADAERICRHEFDVLGTGLRFWGSPIQWDRDPSIGCVWPLDLYRRPGRMPPSRGDVKIPWELSRMQHLPTLAKAFALTGNLRYLIEYRDQVIQWIVANPCPYGVNWASPMEASIRVLNVLWSFRILPRVSELGSLFQERLTESVYEHGQFVRQNLEFGVTKQGHFANGNHLLSNLLALLHLGLLFPHFPNAPEWRRIGVNGLLEEMEGQVAQDGSHVEHSTWYHRLVVEFFTAALLICRQHNVVLPEGYYRKLEAMYDFLLYVSRPDRTLPFIGDADDGRLYILADYSSCRRNDIRSLLGIGAALFGREDMAGRVKGADEEVLWWLGPSAVSALEAQAQDQSSQASRIFKDFGLGILRNNGDYLAAVGFCSSDEIGNHRHNDLLSFELTVGGRPVVVDPGTFSYNGDPFWRNVFRSTSYHNTIAIDGQEQNRFDPDSLFAMSNDTTTGIAEASIGGDKEWFELEHSGFKLVQTPVTHSRRFEYEPTARQWTARDRVKARGNHSLDWFLHFENGVTCEMPETGAIKVKIDGLELLITLTATVQFRTTCLAGFVSHRYGEKLPAPVLHLEAVFRDSVSLDCSFTILKDVQARASNQGRANYGSHRNGAAR